MSVVICPPENPARTIKCHRWLHREWVLALHRWMPAGSLGVSSCRARSESAPRSLRLTLRGARKCRRGDSDCSAAGFEGIATGVCMAAFNSAEQCFSACIRACFRSAENCFSACIPPAVGIVVKTASAWVPFGQPRRVEKWNISQTPDCSPCVPTQQCVYRYGATSGASNMASE